MFFIPIVAGWALGVTSAKLVDHRRERHGVRITALSSAMPSPMVEETHESTSSEVESQGNVILKFKKEKIDPLFKDMRTRYLKEISLEEEVLSEEQKMANQRFVFACGLAVSTTVSALLYPPLVYLHLPFLLYLNLPFYKEAFDTLFKERKVTSRVVGSFVGIGSMSYTIFRPTILVIGAIGGVVFALTDNLIMQTKDGTRKNLTNLMGEQPKYVWVLRDEPAGGQAGSSGRGIEVEIPFDLLQVGDIIVIDAGQMIPVDGMIHEGVASIDQHLLTGESQPAEKGIGDPVFAATVVLSGKIYIRVKKTGEETAAAQVGQILIHTSDFASSVQLRGREVADKMALPTVVLAALSWPIVGPSQALAILGSGFGLSMQILGPLSVLNFLQITAHQGILIKDGRALEQIGKVDTVVFDKTGTLTLEQPHVGTIHTSNGYDETEVLTLAAAAEHRQTHPIAKAIQEEADNRGLSLPAISEAAYEVGYGIKVTLDGKLIRVGSQRFMGMESIAIPEEIDAKTQIAHSEGHSLVYLAIDEQLAGAIELVPTVRPEAKGIIDGLRQAGMEMYIISGDHERPTRALAEQLGIDHFFAETLPENKADLISQLQEQGKSVCFVGDGINDSIALKKANVSVSLRGASTIATDTAQVILMDQSLSQLQILFEISEQFEANMHNNLMTSVLPGVIITSGALVGVVGYATSIVLLYAGLIAGVTNAMLPRFRLLKDES